MTNKTIEAIAREIVEGWADIWVNDNKSIAVGGLGELEDAIREALQSQMPSEDRKCERCGKPCGKAWLCSFECYATTFEPESEPITPIGNNKPKTEPIVPIGNMQQPQEREMPSDEDAFRAGL